MKLAITGHRPGSRGIDYSEATFNLLVDLAARHLTELKPESLLCGMALGFDQAAATAAIRLGIPIHAYVPFTGQADRWSKRQNEDYSTLLQQCSSRRIVSPGGYENWKFQKRNEAMVDDSDGVLALWDGSPSGTGNCVTYAELLGVPVTNLWPEWEEINSMFV